MLAQRYCHPAKHRRLLAGTGSIPASLFVCESCMLAVLPFSTNSVPWQEEVLPRMKAIDAAHLDTEEGHAHLFNLTAVMAFLTHGPKVDALNDMLARNL